MRAKLRRLHSPDIADLRAFAPKAPFGFLLQVFVGPSDGAGEDSFDVIVCSPDWLGRAIGTRVVSGRHYVIMNDYDYDELEQFWNRACNGATGPDWATVAARLARIGQWEFEDYDVGHAESATPRVAHA